MALGDLGADGGVGPFRLVVDRLADVVEKATRLRRLDVGAELGRDDGREVRILVRPEEIDDLSATRLARDIVRKIEETLSYPGQIKVTVIRETRSVEYAK